MIIDKNTAKTHKVIVGRTYENDFYPIQIDSVSHSMSILDHHVCLIHQGRAFSAFYSGVTAATDGHRSGLYIKTPLANGLVHVIASFSSSTAANLSICENVTIAANTGTHGVTIYNRDRANVKTSKCYDNATTPAINKFTTLTEAQIAGDGTWATGTIIREAPLVAGGGPKPAGGSYRDNQEYVLLPDTKYAFLITNTAALANTHYIFIDWYEH